MAFGLIWLSFLVASCAHTPMNSDYLGPKPLPADIEREFEYIRFDGDYSSAIIEKNQTFVLKKIRFTPDTNILDTRHDIILEFYEIKSETKTPVILVLPILGGSNYFANTFARYFAENGYSAIIVHRQKQYKTFKDIDKVDKILRQIVFDHKQALDWIGMQPDLDSECIGVFGISMGSIKAALISSLDKRIKVSVMCLTGGNLAEIIATSDEKGVVRRREQYMEKNNLSIEAFYDLLQSKISCDPINYAEYVDAQNSLMVLGRFDSTVPYKNGNDLWVRMGRPEKIDLMTGHYTAILGLPYIKMKSLDFFDRKLR
jgi:hypothetical protein